MIIINILIVDDERLIVKGLKNSLEQQGYIVYPAYDGHEAMNIIRKESIDFVILDLMLPDTDGMILCKKIREDYSMPILMLSAKDGDYDKILGFELGADDYMTKPFNTMELVARIKAIHRRSQNKDTVDNIEINELLININERRVYVRDEEIRLTAKEFDLLYLLASNPRKVYTRENIYTLLWNEEAFDVRNIDVHVRNIREKIEVNPKDPNYIKTKWGVGYYFHKN